MICFPGDSQQTCQESIVSIHVIGPETKGLEIPEVMIKMGDAAWWVG
jgi:hypothetical protein